MTPSTRGAPLPTRREEYVPPEPAPVECVPPPVAGVAAAAAAAVVEAEPVPAAGEGNLVETEVDAPIGAGLVPTGMQQQQQQQGGGAGGLVEAEGGSREPAIIQGADMTRSVVATGDGDDAPTPW